MAINPEYVCMVDFKAAFVRFIVRAEIPKDAKIPEEHQKRFKKALLIDENQKNHHIALLKKYGIEKYVVEELAEPPKSKITKGVKYGSCEEILAHIQKGVEPKSLEIPRLKERLAAAESQAQAAKAKAETLEAELANVKADVAEMKAIR